MVIRTNVVGRILTSHDSLSFLFAITSTKIRVEKLKCVHFIVWLSAEMEMRPCHVMGCHCRHKNTEIFADGQ